MRPAVWARRLAPTRKMDGRHDARERLLSCMADLENSFPLRSKLDGPKPPYEGSIVPRRHWGRLRESLAGMLLAVTASGCDPKDESSPDAEESDEPDSPADRPTAPGPDTSTTSETDSSSDTEERNSCEFEASVDGPDCDACISAACCPQVSACRNESDCLCFIDCLATTTDSLDPAGCFEACGLDDFPPAFYEIFPCRNEACPDVCSIGGTSGTGGEDPTTGDTPDTDDTE
jgi:hypothetical protein